MNLPNKITLSRIALIPIIVVLLSLRNMTGIFGANSVLIINIASAVIFAIASLTDGIDGHIARKYNLVTDLGKFLDPIADKLLVAAAMICLVELQEFPAWMAIVIIAREFIVTGLRIVAIGQGIVMAAEMTGKIKTVVQIIAVLTVLFFGNNGPLKPLFGFSLGWWSMLIASLFTIYSGYVYLAKNWKLVVNSK
ncbi:MAG: CDP-diacylglycerol--glycerol-3-phosphate 3-phosphatidyltransferase [Ruminococcaceae bacterium]|nr:CDP-diacylglycerol--glycerol-3-phosphate 3-phosphatidyltransferase [Oscillospiraceae bacterium]